jgi:hypothetical protein
VSALARRPMTEPFAARDGVEAGRLPKSVVA